MSTNPLVEWLNKAAAAIYLATEASVADEISPKLLEAATALTGTSTLIKAAQDVLDSISFDDNGAMIGGKWMGGHGGLLSVETRTKTDALRRAISTISDKT